MGSSSPAGYIYPSLWLQEQFDKNITELPHAVQSDSYGSAFARLASGQIDVLCTYADARRDYADKWTSEYAMTNSIWEDTAVIGVTPAIYNDTISVSKSSPIMDDDFKAALSQAVHQHRRHRGGQGCHFHLQPPGLSALRRPLTMIPSAPPRK